MTKLNACFLLLTLGRIGELAQLHYAFLQAGGMNPTSGSPLTFPAVIVLGKGMSLAVYAAEPYTPLWCAVYSHNPESIWEESRNQFGLLPSAKFFKERIK